ERLGDVRRQRRDARRLALEAQPPAPLAEMLDQLDRPVPPAGLQAARRARERLPLVAVDALEQQHLAARRLDRDACGDDLRVVDDDQLPVQLLRQLRERAVARRAARAVVDQQARFVPARGRVLRDQLVREVLVDLVASGWRAVNDRLAAIETSLQQNGSAVVYRMEDRQQSA